MSLNVRVIRQNDDLCGIICNFLRAEGHSVACCGEENHPHSVEAAENPDLIIIEVARPELKAIETVTRLHRSPATRHVPVIIISDFAELELELLHIFDFINKPVDLGRLREDISLLEAGASKRNAAIKLPSLTHEEHEKFHDFLILHSGLHFERRNIKALERGLTSRMTALRLNSFGDYFSYLSENMERRQELQKLLQHLTVGETFFFRYHAHFEALHRIFKSKVTESAPKRGLRIWSAGCSTGEEPYSIAMTIMESFPDWKNRDIRVIATDINSRSLRRARDGVYNDWKVRVTEERYLERYFKHVGESHLVREEVKSLVEFSYFNLQTPSHPPAETYDVIFCRNVMIYFTTATTKRIVDYFAASLKPGGYLFLGHSETLANISSKFERHIHEGGFYYRKKDETVKKSAALPAAAPAPARSEVPVRPAPVRPAVVAAPPVEDDPEMLYAQGASLLHGEKFCAAAEKFEKILRQHPDHAGAILGMGQVHLMSGRLEEALSCCNRALAINDLLHEGYFQRGLLYELQEKTEDAFQEYNKAVLLKMDFVMPHYQLGKLYFLAGDSKSSVRELKNCIRLLEKTARETVIPYSGGLSREVFLEQLRKELAMVESAVNR